MGDYFAHYLKIGKTPGRQAAEDFLRELVPHRTKTASSCGPATARTAACCEWVFERCDGPGKAPWKLRSDACRRTERHRYPRPRHPRQPTLAKLLNVDVDGWLAEVPLIREHFAKFGDRLPKGLTEEVDKLEERLKKAK